MGFRRGAGWALLGISTSVAFLAFAYPLFVIRPFRAQGAQELAAALAVLRFAPNVALAAAACGLAMAAFLWRDARRWQRVGIGLAAIAAGGFAGLTHVDVYERMFNPIGQPEFVPASQSSLEADDMVMAVKVNGLSRAYPIRMMGYHHVVNDWLGGVPLVGTY